MCRVCVQCGRCVLRPQRRGRLWAGCVNKEAGAESGEQVAAQPTAQRRSENASQASYQEPGCPREICGCPHPERPATAPPFVQVQAHTGPPRGPCTLLHAPPPCSPSGQPWAGSVACVIRTTLKSCGAELGDGPQGRWQDFPIPDPKPSPGPSPAALRGQHMAGPQEASPPYLGSCT